MFGVFPLACSIPSHFRCHFFKSDQRQYSSGLIFKQIAVALHSAMSKCCKEGCNSTVSKRCQKNLCGSCCQPPCSETAHGQRGTARGRAGKPKQRRWHDAWNGAVEFVSGCLKTPGALKFMAMEHLSQAAVFDAVFKVMKSQFQEAPAEAIEDPSRARLDQQISTLNCILGPRALYQVGVMMDSIPVEVIEQGPPRGDSGVLDQQEVQPSPSVSSPRTPVPPPPPCSSATLMKDASTPSQPDVAMATDVPPGNWFGPVSILESIPILGI
jgi:hypothetical protein